MPELGTNLDWLRSDLFVHHRSMWEYSQFRTIRRWLYQCTLLREDAQPYERPADNLHLALALWDLDATP